MTAACPPLTVTVLGCGNSIGVPLPGCDCAVCTSADPRNNRLRASILVESATTRLLIDCGPDLRQQSLRQRFHKVDAVVLTHAHADHINGADDLRIFNMSARDWIPVWAAPEHMLEFSTRFDYAFRCPAADGVWYKPCLLGNAIQGPFTIGDIPLVPLPVQHGSMVVQAFRFGDFAYVTDCHSIPETTLHALEGLDTLIIDCVTYEIPSPFRTHSDLPSTLRWLERLKPRQAYFTHMSHHFDYTRLSGELSPGVAPAYDGLVFKANQKAKHHAA